MNCIQWEERIAMYAGGDLSASEAEAVERHLADCPGCQLFWSGLRETLATLRASHAQEIDESHFDAVRANVIGEIERARKVWRRLAWVSGVGIAAALLVVLAHRGAGNLARSAGNPAGAPVSVAAAPPLPPPIELRVSRPVANRPQVTNLPHRLKLQIREPVLVKLQTADPHIVIYWIAD